MKNKTIFDVPLFIHWSSLIILGLLVYQGGMLGVAFFGILFFSVILHEYAHVLVAQRLNNDVKYVTFMAFGAAAAVELKPEYSAAEEAKISIAGPLMSILLAILGYILSYVSPSKIASYTFNINLILAVFNLLPLYPTDGGRVLNALIASKVGIIKAVYVSAITSTVLCSIGVLFGIYTKNVWLITLFILIPFMAWQQRNNVNKTYGENLER